MNKNAVIIMAKSPIAGEVKTRLAKTIGEEKACEVYQHLLKHTCQIAANKAWDTTIFYDNTLENTIAQDYHFTIELQSDGNIGDRMQAAFETMFSNGYDKVVLIGSDCLEIDQNTLKSSFTNLSTHDTVLGPARDGGYYLIGLKNRCAEIFEDINWSTNTVFEATVNKIKNIALSVAVLDEKTDIDTIKELRQSGLNWE